MYGVGRELISPALDASSTWGFREERVIELKNKIVEDMAAMLTDGVTQFFDEILVQVSDYLRYFHYLGPLRKLPPRDQIVSSDYEVEMQSGAYAWSVLTDSFPLRSKVNRWLGSK